MVKLDSNTINELAEILRPFVESERERQSFLIAALGNDAPVLQHIIWGGSVATFIPQMMHKLADFGGRQTLCAVLEYGRSQMSAYEDVQQRIDKLIHQLDQSAPTTSEINNIDLLVRRVRDRLHDKIQRLHGTMPLLGVDHWVDLGELFVDVNIQEEVSSSRKSELNDLWQDFRLGVKEDSSYRSLDRIGLGKQQQRVPGLTVLAKNTNLMVLGKPGSGKTTYLQRIVTECNECRLLPQRIPMLIKLREFVDDCRRFEYSLERYLSQQWRLSDAEAELVLNQGRALILLDGLDEVTGTDGRAITKQIKLFARTYPQNQLIVTCRTQSQESRFERFDYVEVADFNDAQVNVFVQHWFNAVCSNAEEGQVKARKFLENLYFEENKTIRELAITPILLSLTCVVFQAHSKFYLKRSKLYEEGLELLLEKWDKSWEIERDEIYRDLLVDRKQELLSFLAVKKFEQPQYVLFEQEEIERYIAEFLQISRRDSRVILRAIEAQHGLLIERAQKVWSFSHLTFQEYLVAKWFVDRDHWQSLVNHITDKHWREVFLLAVGILKPADELLKEMKRWLDAIVANDRDLKELLIMVSRKSSTVNQTYESTAIRAFYFDLLLIRIVPINFINENLDSTWFSTRGSDFATILGLGFELTTKLDNCLTVGFDFGFISYKPSESAFGDVYAFTDLTLTNDLALDFSLVTAWVIAYCFAIDYAIHLPAKEIKKASSILVQALSLALENSCGYELEKPLQHFREKLFDIGDSQQQLKNWYVTQGQVWAEQLRIIMLKHRNIGHNWQFHDHHKELLKKYYDANILLVDCLNSGCFVSDTVRQEIEDTLLLPITDIENRRGLRRNLEQ